MVFSVLCFPYFFHPLPFATPLCLSCMRSLGNRRRNPLAWLLLLWSLWLHPAPSIHPFHAKNSLGAAWFFHCLCILWLSCIIPYTAHVSEIFTCMCSLKYWNILFCDKVRCLPCGFPFFPIIFVDLERA